LADEKRARDHREAFEKEGDVYRTHDRAGIRDHGGAMHYDGDWNKKQDYQPSP